LAITKQQRKAARKLVRELKSPKQALLAAGYSHATAQRGAHQILDSRGLRFAVLEEMAKMRETPLPTAEEQSEFIRWRLLINALNGEDRAVQSLRLLGQDRRCSLFTPEASQGVIVIQVPKDIDPSILEDASDSHPPLKAAEESRDLH
jgi:hypothetical protein